MLLPALLIVALATVIIGVWLKSIAWLVVSIVASALAALAL